MGIGCWGKLMEVVGCCCWLWLLVGAWVLFLFCFGFFIFLHFVCLMSHSVTLLPRIVPNFSSSVTFNLCLHLGDDVDDVWLFDGVGDEDDWWSVMSKSQSQSSSVYICLLSCCLYKYFCLHLSCLSLSHLLSIRSLPVLVQLHCWLSDGKGTKWQFLFWSSKLSGLLSVMSSKADFKMFELSRSKVSSAWGFVFLSSVCLSCSCLPSLLSFVSLNPCIQQIFIHALHLGHSLWLGQWLQKWNGWNMLTGHPLGE